MDKKITSVIFLLATMVVISSSGKLGLPDSFKWPKNTDKLCFAANFTLRLNINYTKNDGSVGSGVIPLNSTTFETYSVSCSAPNNVHQLVISMLNSLTVIIFDFVVDDKDVTSLKKVHGYITLNEQQSIITDYSTSVNGSYKFSSNESLFEVARNKAYQCYSKTEIKGFQTNANLAVVSIDIENLKMEPFADASKPFDAYSDATECKADADKNSNLVPIIVGACLAALVVFVLIVYLIGRRRSRTGYQSV